MARPMIREAGMASLLLENPYYILLGCQSRGSWLQAGLVWAVLDLGVQGTAPGQLRGETTQRKGTVVPLTYSAGQAMALQWAVQG